MADSTETTDQVRGALNYGRVPDPLLRDPDIPGDACKLYATLTRYGQQRDRVVPGRPELAERLGWSVDKLDKMTAALEATGLLYVERRKGDDGRNLRSVYWIDGSRPPDVPPGRKSAATPSRKSAATTTSANAQTPSSDPSRKSAAQEHVELEQEYSATTVAGSDAADATNEQNPQTFLARLIDYVRQRTGDETYRPDPREIGKLTDCFALRISVGDPAEVIDAGARDWADAQPARDASQLASFIGARRRSRPAKGKGDQRTREGEPFTRAPRPPDHDGRHDQTCWCYRREGENGGPIAIDRAAIAAALPGYRPPVEQPVTLDSGSSGDPSGDGAAP